MEEYLTIPKLARKLDLSDNTVRRYTKNYPQFFRKKWMDGWEHFPADESIRLIQKINSISAAGKIGYSPNTSMLLRPPSDLPSRRLDRASMLHQQNLSLLLNPILSLPAPCSNSSSSHVFLLPLLLDPPQQFGGHFQNLPRAIAKVLELAQGLQQLRAAGNLILAALPWVSGKGTHAMLAC